MIISKIIEHKYSYKIYVDEEYIGIIKKKTLKKNKFLENKNVDDIELLKKTIFQDEYESAKNKALRQLGFSQKTEREIVNKLEKDFFSDNTIQKVIEFLKEYQFLNDENYAKNYTQTIKKTGKSKKAIQSNLIKKGFEKDLISNTLDMINEEDEYTNALKVGQKKYKLLKSDNIYENAKKLKLYLSYKGFNYNISDKVTREILENADNNI